MKSSLSVKKLIALLTAAMMAILPFTGAWAAGEEEAPAAEVQEVIETSPVTADAPAEKADPEPAPAEPKENAAEQDPAPAAAPAEEAPAEQPDEPAADDAEPASEEPAAPAAVEEAAEAAEDDEAADAGDEAPAADEAAEEGVNAADEAGAEGVDAADEAGAEEAPVSEDAEQPEEGADQPSDEEEEEGGEGGGEIPVDPLEAGPGTVTVASVDPSAKAVVAGQSITFTAKIVHSSPYMLYYRWYRDSVQIGEGSMSTDSITLTPSVAGTYSLKVEAWNSETEVWESSATSGSIMVVTSAFSYTALNVESTQIALGNGIKFTPNVTGGSGNCEYTYYVYKDGVLVTSNTTTSSGAYTYVPTEAGVYYCRAVVTDKVFEITISQTSQNVTVYEALKIDSITPSALLLEIGSTVTFTVAASGGVGSYLYDYDLFWDGVENDVLTDSTSNVYSNTPALAGYYQLRVTVTDSIGNTVESSSSLVEFVDKLAVTSITADYTKTETNFPITFTATYTGVPTRGYWEIMRDGEVAFSQDSTSDTITYTPTIPGKYTAKLTLFLERGLLKIEASGISGEVDVQEELAVHGVSVNGTVLPLGTAMTFTAETSGGITPKDYVFRIYKEVDSTWKLIRIASNQTGSFTYTPTSIGTYYCEAGVKDAWHASYFYVNSAEVDIVQEIVFNKVTVSSAQIPLGSPVTFTPIISGGTGSYKFIYCVFQGKKQLTMTESTAASFDYTPKELGTYTCTVYAADDTNNWKNVTSDAVNVLNSIASVTVTLSAGALYTGQTETITATAVGNATVYNYRIYNGDGSKVVDTSSNSNSYKYTPPEPGTYKVEVDAWDGISWKQGTPYPATFEVYKPFAFTKLDVSHLKATVGDKLGVAPTVEGGAPTVQFIYCIFDSKQQLTMYTTTSGHYEYTFNHPDTYRVDVYAGDGLGTWIMRSVTGIVVTDTSVLGIKEIKVSPTSTTVGNPITYTVTATGAPTQYIYCVFRNGQQVTMDYSTSTTYTYNVTSEGVYTITVYATNGSDWVNMTASDSTTVAGNAFKIVSVTPTSATSIPLGSNILFKTTVSGASGSVQYIHCVFQGSKQLTMTYSSSPNFVYKPKETGAYHIEVYCTDSTGVWLNSSSAVVQVGEVSELKLNVTTNSTDLTVGDHLTINPNASGGYTTSGNYTYIYCLWKDGVQLTMDWDSATSKTYQVTSAGSYRVDVYCCDDNDTWIMQSSANITVHGV